MSATLKSQQTVSPPNLWGVGLGPDKLVALLSRLVVAVVEVQPEESGKGDLFPAARLFSTVFLQFSDYFYCNFRGTQIGMNFDGL